MSSLSRRGRLSDLPDYHFFLLLFSKFHFCSNFCFLNQIWWKNILDSSYMCNPDGIVSSFFTCIMIKYKNILILLIFSKIWKLEKYFKFLKFEYLNVESFFYFFLNFWHINLNWVENLLLKLFCKCNPYSKFFCFLFL